MSSPIAYASAAIRSRLNTADSLFPSWDRSIPSKDKTTWRDPAVADAYVKAALASDPTSASRTHASFRSPSGALEDSFYLAPTLGRQPHHCADADPAQRT
ncbi:hypothetical protein [Nonomuraea sp. bgisy101]|uniref:hypothetical protein n=1 Tax=Nonomuraea sp. bgisy101 TaxID=3413784 RepID=UPI003D75AD03